MSREERALTIASCAIYLEEAILWLRAQLFGGGETGPGETELGRGNPPFSVIWLGIPQGLRRQ